MVEIEIDRPEERRAIYRPLVEDCLSQNGPLTARMIAEKTGLQKHQVNSALESKKGLLFFLLDSKRFVWGVKGQKIEDMRLAIRKHQYDVIADYLRKVESATTPEIALHTGFHRCSISVAIAKHPELFEMTGRKSRAPRWKLKDELKEAA